MAKTSLITIPPGLDTTYNKVIQSGDRFIYPHVKVKRLFTSRKRKKGLTQRSLFVSLAPVWNAFDSATKDAWTQAGLRSDLSGFKLFVQDTAIRRAENLPGYAIPSNHYQSMVGKIQIEAPAVGLTIMQLHPQSYYINRKIPGTRSKYEPVLISENLSLPVNIEIDYKADLLEVDENPYAKFYITIYSNYQGKTIENKCEIPFNILCPWEHVAQTIVNVQGQFRGYNAFIELHSLRGTLLFDNVVIYHSGQNWARDPHCNSIQTTFTKAFYQIPRNWIPTEIISGAFYGSVYHAQS